MSTPSIYTPEIVRRVQEYKPHYNSNPPSVYLLNYRHTKGHYQSRLRFNVEAVRRFGIGTKYKSCKAGYCKDLDEIVLSLSRERKGFRDGYLRLTLFGKGKSPQVWMSVGGMMRRFDLYLRTGRWYPVTEIDPGVIAIALDDWVPAQRAVRRKRKNETKQDGR